ncbi:MULTISPECIES: ATP-grasp domain-containing protein [unclassified Streptomyces]|uniref:preATP grasp domain-containing protein n=1 Tax=unclassified Streptomyces TaxID=2593676 RepID=UPI0036E30984
MAPTAPLVFLGNFEVERQWGENEPGIPTFNFPSSDVLVNRMDEFTLNLAGPDDIVVLKRHPDADYLAYLEKLGRRLPRILTPEVSDPGRDVTADALADGRLLAELSGLRARGAMIVAHGVSAREERLSELTGLPLGAPTAAVCKAVNSKVYSRELADRLQLRQPAGRWCDSLETWQEAAEWARGLLRNGAEVAVKDAYGVSGKGILQITEEARLDQLSRMFTSRSERRSDNRLGVVVEEWVSKETDLNYQFSVGRDGSTRLDFVKEALTEKGVHKGHLVPARITAVHLEEINSAARSIGTALAADGYFGVVGIDAMIDPAGGLYPLTEINARSNMSTYQESLLEMLAPAGWTALARHYDVTLRRPLPFAELQGVLGDLLLGPDSDAGGLIVNNFATVGSGLSAGGSGRLYGIVLGSTLDQVNTLDKQITQALAPWQEGTSA